MVLVCERDNDNLRRPDALNLVSLDLCCRVSPLWPERTPVNNPTSPEYVGVLIISKKRGPLCGVLDPCYAFISSRCHDAGLHHSRDVLSLSREQSIREESLPVPTARCLKRKSRNSNRTFFVIARPDQGVQGQRPGSKESRHAHNHRAQYSLDNFPEIQTLDLWRHVRTNDADV